MGEKGGGQLRDQSALSRGGLALSLCVCVCVCMCVCVCVRGARRLIVSLLLLLQGQITSTTRKGGRVTNTALHLFSFFLFLDFFLIF